MTKSRKRNKNSVLNSFIGCKMKSNPNMNPKLDIKKRQRAIYYSTILSLINYSVKDIKSFFDKVRIFWTEDTQEKVFISEVSKILDFPAHKVSEAYLKVFKIFNAVEFPYEILELSDDIYPNLLKSLSSQPPFLFVRGDTSIFNYPIISIVGTRTPSEEGIQRAMKLALLLVERNIVVASGLARGIDKAAHIASLRMGGRTIGVLGTPLNVYYPSENKGLQNMIAKTNLLVSQFPFSHPVRPYTFPMRNYTMSGISLATVIVEAKQGSGALYQADFALKQNRKLFIMKHLLEEPGLDWPHTFKDKPGVYILSKVEDLIEQIEKMEIYPKTKEDEFLESGFDLRTIQVGQ